MWVHFPGSPIYQGPQSCGFWRNLREDARKQQTGQAKELLKASRLRFATQMS